MTNRPSRARDGLTLIEAMVVVAIVGVLLSLVSVAIQSIREKARMHHCQNNVRQLALATQEFVGAHVHFPSNGWGFRWIGQTERGIGPRQPGGWAFQLLPFVEIDLNHATEPDQRARWTQIPMPLFRCPDRPAGLTAHTDLFAPFNATASTQVAKTDYAICEGDFITRTLWGPKSLEEGDDPAYPWKSAGANGISYQRSWVRPADVTDGLSVTYAIGEKQVDRHHYFDGKEPGYDQSLLSGVDIDLSRWVADPPAPDSEVGNQRQFGSAHPSGWHVSNCDGSVRTMSFSIDGVTHARLGSRNDGLNHDLPP